MKGYPSPVQVDPIGRVPREVSKRPFWSVMIPTYNGVTYLERTLASVLAQDPGREEMQIEVVDDGSTVDDPEDLVARAGRGRVTFFRQPHHLGTSANYNSCINRSVGRWIHILNSDDIILPGFYERFKAVLAERDDIGAAFCRHAYIDEAGDPRGLSDPEIPTPGVIPDFVSRIGMAQTICSPSVMVVGRSVYENLGGFRADLPCAGDWEMWIRIAAHYPCWYEPEILAAWREHSHQSSAAFRKLGEDIADMRHCVELSRCWLPSDRARSISRKAREYLASWAFSNAGSAMDEGELRIACRQVWEGLKCSASPRALKGLLRLFFRVAVGGMRPE